VSTKHSIGLAAGLVAAALAVPAGASAAAIRGTVVHQSPRAHSFVVADARGGLTAVHAARSPKVGRRVVVQASRLRNGTYNAAHTRVAGVARRARLRGTVTYADRTARAFVISTRGASLLVHAGGHRRGRARAADALPAVGANVTVSATLGAQGDVVAQQVSNEGDAQGTVDLEGTIRSIDEKAGTFTLSADDAEETGAATVTVHVPDTFDMSAYSVGDELQLTATLNSDGTYTAVGSSDDGDAQQADDSSDDQGDDGNGDGGESGQSSHGSKGGSGGGGDSSGGGDD
jgi:uncharacterized membrane protein YgcG